MRDLDVGLKGAIEKRGGKLGLEGGILRSPQ